MSGLDGLDDWVGVLVCILVVLVLISYGYHVLTPMTSVCTLWLKVCKYNIELLRSDSKAYQPIIISHLPVVCSLSRLLFLVLFAFILPVIFSTTQARTKLKYCFLYHNEGLVLLCMEFNLFVHLLHLVCQRVLF